MVNDLTYVKNRIFNFETIGAFILRWKRHKHIHQAIREPIERFFMNCVKRKYRQFDPKETLWKKISIGVVSTCNGTCSFCPSTEMKRKPHTMGSKLYEQIIQQLVDIDYAGEIGLNLQSDPFVIQDVIWRVNFAASKCPKATVFLSTNGLALTQEKYHAVLKQPNVRMLINDYSQDGRKIKEVKSWNRTRTEKKRTFLVNKIEPNSVTNVSYFKSAFVLPLGQFCVAPFIQLCVGPQGEGVACCLDWKRYYEDGGDANEQSLKEIWGNSRMHIMRQNLLNNMRIGLCESCDMMGHRWSLK